MLIFFFARLMGGISAFRSASFRFFSEACFAVIKPSADFFFLFLYMLNATPNIHIETFCSDGKRSSNLTIREATTRQPQKGKKAKKKKTTPSSITQMLCAILNTDLRDVLVPTHYIPLFSQTLFCVTKSPVQGGQS